MIHEPSKTGDVTELTLVSHVLCPYVQRAVIALKEKGTPYNRLDVDLGARPDWFTHISPLGKVPLLMVGQGPDRAVIFESMVILEYLEETQPHPLHPVDPLTRARHRSWVEFGSAMLATIARLYYAKSDESFAVEIDNLRQGFERIEREMAQRRHDTFFEGRGLSLVDVTYGPIFRYFDALEDGAALRLLEDLSAVSKWRKQLADRDSIRTAVVDDFHERLLAFLAARGSVLSRRMISRSRQFAT